jgi:hypothetical protein
VLLGRQKIQFMPVQLALSSADVHLAAFQQFRWGSGEQFFKRRKRFIVLAILHQLQGCLVVLENRSRTRSGVAGWSVCQWMLFLAIMRHGSSLLPHKFARSLRTSASAQA